MDTSPLGLACSIIPQVPNALITALKAIFGILISDDSPQDFITQLAVIFIRPVLGTPASLLQSQNQLNKDWGVWGRMWIAKCTIPRPENYYGGDGCVFGAKQALFEAIRYLGGEGLDESTCGLADVEAEWTSYRSGVSYIARRPDIAESEQYSRMMGGLSEDAPTILYMHGGAACLMDPVTHRLTTSSLARASNGRCLSLRFRLAPQHAFPAALLDTFVAYLSLLSPPPSSLHDAVPTTRIVLAGDSSGAGLASSLLLLLLTIRKMNITHIRFHGRNVDITGGLVTLGSILNPPVAGLALASPWLDVSRCLPSVHANAQWDIIAPPSKDFDKPCPNFPHDSIWPTKPPRVETYCNAEMVTHPLVSPLAARTEFWQGAPPVYLSIGWESMQDEAEVFARRVYTAGSAVEFDGYVGMPHCFSMVPWNWQGRQAQRNWGRFCYDAVNGEIQRTHLGTWTRKNHVVTKVELGALGMWYDLDDDKVSELLMEQRNRRIVLEKQLLDE